jgi:hypothetical protein
VFAILAWVMFCTPATHARDVPNVLAYADVDLRYAGGQVTILKVRPGRFEKPTSLPLYRGRFVAIVGKGKTSLVELQFDFPLLSDTETEDMTPEARALAQRIRKGATSSTTVRVPLPAGADTVSVWDSVSRKTVAAPLATSPAVAPPARDPPRR